MFSFKKQIKENKKDYLESLEKVLNHGMAILGPETKELETKLAEYTGSKNVVCCHSGTFALTLALEAIDLKPGDEVITTPFTWISTVSTIVKLGAVPVFVDISEKDYNMEISKIQDKITEKTKCVLFVNIFGRLIQNITFLHNLRREYGFYIIEDAAQSFGAYNKDFKSCDGKIADISCTSFYPTKPLSGFGDGGACFTNNEKLYNRLVALRNHGMGPNSAYAEHELVGYNARMNTFQGAILLKNLEHFENKTKNRLERVSYYNENLNLINKPEIIEGHVFAQYSFQIENRDSFIEHLKKNEIPYKIFYAKSMADQPVFKRYKTESLPICEKVCETIISIPCYDTLEYSEIDRIINVINSYLE